MSSTLIANLPMATSRPKVHRPPSLGARKPQEKPGFPGFLLFWAAVLLTLVVVALFINKGTIDKSEGNSGIKAAATLPEVAVVSQRLPAAAVPEQEISVIPTAIGDAQAETGSLPMSILPEKLPEKQTATASATIRLQDKSNVIVGQMAKIPLENEQITEVKTINEVDNGGGHELLSILNKY